LTGHLDLRAPGIIVDFKSGRKVNSKKNRIQLYGYRDLARHNGLGEHEVYNVFLGDRKGPVEFQIPEEQMREVESEFWRLVERRKGILKLLKAGKTVECKVGIGCAYCPYRHVCSGY